MPSQPSPFADVALSLGPYRVQPRELLLQGPQHSVRLEPRVMQVLLCLGRHAGATVTREELLADAWPGMVVSDDAVHRAISKLRNALAAVGDGLAVETVPRVGYRLRLPRIATDPAMQEGATGELIGSASEAESASAQPPAATGVGPVNSLSWHDRSGVRGLALIAALIALGLGVWWRWPPAREVPPQPTPHWTTLRLVPSLGHMPVFAPDGLRLLYSLGTPQGEQLWLQPWDGSGEAQALTDTSGMDYASSWSATGDRIAFIRQLGEDCSVMVIEAGQAPRRLTDCTRMNGRLTLSPDGRQLVLSDRPDPAQRANTLYLVEVDSGHRTPLLLPPGEEGDYRPRWSPNGEWIAFTRVYARLHARVMRVRADGSQIETLAEPDHYVHQLAWRGNTELIYTLAGSELNALWHLRLGEPPRMLTTVGPGKPSIDVSPDGRRLALSLSQLVRQNRRLHLQEARLETLPEPLTSARDLALAPDGRRIAFEQERLGDAGIWLLDTRSPNPRKLWGISEGRITDLSWNAQGQSLAFELSLRGDQDICHLDLEGAVDCHQQPEHRAMAPSWSRDGRWLYYASTAGGGWHVFRARPDGSQAHQLSARQSVYARESVDGRQVLLRARGEDGIWQHDLDSGRETLLIDDAAFAQPRAFEPVHDGIYYVDRSQQLVFYPYRDGIKRVLYRFEGSPPRVLNLSPDRTQLLFAQTTHEQADLAVLTNLDALMR
jgi:Tol biopolymer transport system component/DNA-binding winged helix-turn-helix (wHTH) protein